MSAAMLAVGSLSGPASGQLVFGGSDFTDPYIMCKAWVSGTSTMWASGQAPNEVSSSDRFYYWANKYGEKIGKTLRMRCVRFENITPEYRRSFEPGSSFVDTNGTHFTLVPAPFLPDNWSMTPTPEEKAATEAEAAKRKPAKEETAPASASKSPAGDQAPTPEKPKSAAKLAAEEAAAKRAEREAEFQARHAEYERKLAEQQKMVDDYKRAQAEVARTKEEQQAKADAAAAAFKAEQDAYVEKIRQHDEREAAAKQLMADWDARHGLKSKASTEDDANRCVTTAETQVDATFKGNTAASVVNGCGQPVDVRVCLMTAARGWNCGVTWGLESQQRWSHSSFDATGPIFVDARVSGSARPLAQPR